MIVVANPKKHKVFDTLSTGIVPSYASLEHWLKFAFPVGMCWDQAMWWFPPGRSRWPHGLRFRPAVARSFRLRVRIPQRTWLSVSCWVLCVVRWRSLRRADPSSRESYLMCLCVSLRVNRCKINPLHLQWLGRRARTKKETNKQRTVTSPLLN